MVPNPTVYDFFSGKYDNEITPTMGYVGHTHKEAIICDRSLFLNMTCASYYRVVDHWNSLSYSVVTANLFIKLF